MPQRESPTGTIAQEKMKVTECTQIVQKECTQFFADVLSYVKKRILKNVHFRISLREMQKVSSDAVYAAEKICQSLRSLNLRLAEEKIRKRKDNLHGDVPFPAQIG